MSDSTTILRQAYASALVAEDEAATEASALMRRAEERGDRAFAEACLRIARHHRVEAIMLRAKLDACSSSPMGDDPR